MHPESFLIDRLHTQKHVLESKRLPEPEHLLIAQQDIATCLHVVLFFYPSSRNSFTDFESLLRLDECDIVDQEDPRFLNLF